MNNLSKEEYQASCADKNLIGHWDVVLIIKPGTKEKVLKILSDNFEMLSKNTNPLQLMAQLVENFSDTTPSNKTPNITCFGKVSSLNKVENKIVYAIERFDAGCNNIEILTEDVLIPIVKSWSILDLMCEFQKKMAEVGVVDISPSFNGITNIDLSFKLNCRPKEFLITLPDIKEGI